MTPRGASLLVGSPAFAPRLRKALIANHVRIVGATLWTDLARYGNDLTTVPYVMIRESDRAAGVIAEWLVAGQKALHGGANHRSLPWIARRF